MARAVDEPVDPKWDATLAKVTPDPVGWFHGLENGAERTTLCFPRFPVNHPDQLITTAWEEYVRTIEKQNARVPQATGWGMSRTTAPSAVRM
jgi:hypothetical protein